MTTKTARRKIIDKVLTSFGIVAMVVLFAIGGLAWWAYSFTTGTVKEQLSSQKIFFPDSGSAAIAALPAEDQVQVNRYAGQQVLTGAQAKVFADNYIAVHLSKIAGGKTYAEVSSAAQANPTDAKLQAQANTLFKGETLRGLLLGDAYAFWTIGEIAKIAAYVSFTAGAIMLVLVLLGIRHLMSI